MRLRFSLRTLFLLMTFVAALCLWFLLPSLTAKRFLGDLASERYQSADACFRSTDDRFLADWSDKRWSFRTSGELLPLTFDQVWRCKRDVRMEVTYFELDQYLSAEMYIEASPFGLGKPERMPTHRVGVVYPEKSGQAVPLR